MGYEAINFGKKFGLFSEQWQPKVIAEMNDYQFKIVKLEGDFIWHDHKDTDETFIVLDGSLRIDFRDGAVHVSAGEMFVVPKGVEHKPYAEHEVKLLLIEPRGVLNTGHEGGDRTAENDVWIWRHPFDAAEGIMSVVALNPYAADSSDPGLSGYAEFMKARMPNVDPANFAAEYANMVAQALIVVLQPCKDDLSRENIMAQAANLKGVALLVLLPGITLNLGHRLPPDEGYMVEFRDG